MTKAQAAPKPLPFHEAAGLFPLMEGKDFEDLKADIRANGLREPVWTYQGAVIDGRNRYRACREVGVEPAFREWDGKGSPVAFVVSLNLHRRHLTADQKRAVIAALVKDDPTRSNRQVAARVGTDHKTVGKVRTDLAATGEIPQLERTTGKDGKSRPATRPTPPAAVPATGQPEPVSVPVHAAEVRGETPPGQSARPVKPAVDGLGTPVPEDLAAVFATRDDFAPVLQACKELAVMLDALAHKPGGKHLALRCGSRTHSGKRIYHLPVLRRLEAAVRESRPHVAHCPFCRNLRREPSPACPYCEGDGWVDSRGWKAWKEMQKDAPSDHPEQPPAATH